MRDSADSPTPCERLEKLVTPCHRGLTRNGRQVGRDDDGGCRIALRDIIVNGLA
jgi:hypothetical protein